MKVLLFANTDWYLYNFRLSLAQDLRDRGDEVMLLSPAGEYGSRLKAMGLRWMSFPLSRRGMNPLYELLTVGRLVRLYRRERPDIVHHFTVKCVLYGSLAASLSQPVKVINSITGLGYLFTEKNRHWVAVLRGLVKVLYRLALKNTHVIFQNPEDQALFIKERFITASQATLISGSGVDTGQFTPLPQPDGVPVVILPGRLLWNKGVGEFVEASRTLKSEGIDARFALVGTGDAANPDSVPVSQLEEWNRDGVVEWWGWQESMQDVFARVHVVCLPSYREGVPKVLLEAGACGRPVVTTDVPGCREIVTHGQNGLLVAPQNVTALADALRSLIKNPDLRSKMGMRGREIVMEKFLTERVNSETLRVYQAA